MAMRATRPIEELTLARESAATSIDETKWSDAIAGLHGALRSRDPIEAATAFAEGLADCLGGVAVVVEVVAPRGERFVVSRGDPCGLVESVAPMLSPCRLGQPSDRIDLMDDIDAAPELGGTLLHDALRRAGIRGWFSMALTADGVRSFGTLVVFVPDGIRVCATARRQAQHHLQRLVLGLELIWVDDAARQRGQLHESIMQCLPEPILVLGCDGRVSSMNRAAAAFLGAASEGLLGRSFVEAFGSDLADGGAGEIELRAADGQRFFAEFRMKEIDGGLGTVLSMIDITKRRSAEVRLAESDRLAMIGTIAAGLGHDMNNVLLPVRAHLNAIASGGRRLGTQQREAHIGHIRSSLSYLQHLSDSLHGLALDPETEGDGLGRTALGSWWAKSRPILEKTLHRRAQLDCWIDDTAPEVAVPPHALTRVVLNLLVNAAEAVPDGRPKSAARVVMRIRGAGTHVVIEVTDNGVGMSDEVRRRVFDMFFTTKTRGLGTGLGLPLVRRIVERSGGAVEIESRVGLGTTVRLILPAATAESDPSRLIARVRIEDGRCAAIVRGYLDVLGVDAESDALPEDADLLILDAAQAVTVEAERWTRVRDARQFVVVGAPSVAEASGLGRLGVTVIHDPDDIKAIERGLVSALGLGSEETNRRDARNV